MALTVSGNPLEEQFRRKRLNQPGVSPVPANMNPAFVAPPAPQPQPANMNPALLTPQQAFSQVVQPQGGFDAFFAAMDRGATPQQATQSFQQNQQRPLSGFDAFFAAADAGQLPQQAVQAFQTASQQAGTNVPPPPPPPAPSPQLRAGTNAPQPPTQTTQAQPKPSGFDEFFKAADEGRTPDEAIRAFNKAAQLPEDPVGRMNAMLGNLTSQTAQGIIDTTALDQLKQLTRSNLGEEAARDMERRVMEQFRQTQPQSQIVPEGTLDDFFKFTDQINAGQAPDVNLIRDLSQVKQDELVKALPPDFQQQVQEGVNRLRGINVGGDPRAKLAAPPPQASPLDQALRTALQSRLGAPDLTGLASSPLEASLRKSIEGDLSLGDINQRLTADPITQALLGQLETGGGKRRAQLEEDLKRLGVVGQTAAGGAANVLGEFESGLEQARLNTLGQGAERLLSERRASLGQGLGLLDSDRAQAMSLLGLNQARQEGAASQALGLLDSDRSQRLAEGQLLGQLDGRDTLDTRRFQEADLPRVQIAQELAAQDVANQIAGRNRADVMLDIDRQLANQDIASSTLNRQLATEQSGRQERALTSDLSTADLQRRLAGLSEERAGRLTDQDILNAIQGRELSAAQSGRQERALTSDLSTQALQRSLAQSGDVRAAQSLQSALATEGLQRQLAQAGNTRADQQLMDALFGEVGGRTTQSGRALQSDLQTAGTQRNLAERGMTLEEQRRVDAVNQFQNTFNLGVGELLGVVPEQFAGFPGAQTLQARLAQGQEGRAGRALESDLASAALQRELAQGDAGLAREQFQFGREQTGRQNVMDALAQAIAARQAGIGGEGTENKLNALIPITLSRLLNTALVAPGGEVPDTRGNVPEGELIQRFGLSPEEVAMLRQGVDIQAILRLRDQ